MQAHDLLVLGAGSIVGFSLGLLGGGGSILAVPLLIYVVGVHSTHVAVGTSALAVAVNAFANLIGHSRAGNVKWPCAAVFSITGMIGAAIGAALGKLVDGERLLFLFGLVMLAVAFAMFAPRAAAGDPNVRITPAIAVRLIGAGLAVGLLSGFFGIGGGFLIVPAIMLGSGMATINAVGSSLLAVGAFGLTTAASYALDGYVDWHLGLVFIVGGIGGGLAGIRTSTALASKRALLNRVFAAAVVLVASFVLYRAARELLH